MSAQDDLIRRITEVPGQSTADLASQTAMPSAAVLGMLKHDVRVEMRGRKWYPRPTPAEAMPDRAPQPGGHSLSSERERMEHPATLKAARVVLAEVAGMLCGALGRPLPEMPPTLPEIEDWIRDLQRQPVRQLAHALGEIADPVRKDELQRLLSKVKQRNGMIQRLRERLSEAVAAGKAVLDLLSEERAE